MVILVIQSQVYLRVKLYQGKVSFIVNELEYFVKIRLLSENEAKLYRVNLTIEHLLKKIKKGLYVSFDKGSKKKSVKK